MNARTIGVIGALGVCVIAGLVVGAVISDVVMPSDKCPEGFVADETYEVCCAAGTIYDPEIDKCRPPVTTTETTTETDQPPVITCSEGEYLGVDDQCHPDDAPQNVPPDPDTGECPEDYYLGWDGVCHKIPEEGPLRLSMLPGTVQGTAITFLTIIMFVGFWWIYVRPRM